MPSDAWFSSPQRGTIHAHTISHDILQLISTRVSAKRVELERAEASFGESTTHWGISAVIFKMTVMHLRLEINLIEHSCTSHQRSPSSPPLTGVRYSHCRKDGGMTYHSVRNSTSLWHGLRLPPVYTVTSLPIKSSESVFSLAKQSNRFSYYWT